MKLIEIPRAENTLSSAHLAWWAFLLSGKSPLSQGGNEKKLICILVVADVRSGPHGQREADALSRAGCEIKVIYPDCYSPSFTDESFYWAANISFRPISCKSGQNYAVFLYVWGDVFHMTVINERPYMIIVQVRKC